MLLECEDVGDAAVNRVLEASLRLVGDGERSLRAIGSREVSEELGGIARTKDLMDGCKVCCPLLMAEVGGENAALHALPPQEFAGTAR